MIRLVRMGGKWYGLEVNLDDEEVESIETFVEEGEVVILCDDLRDIAELLLLDVDDIEMVE